jgi:hypothetical protein
MRSLRECSAVRIEEFSFTRLRKNQVPSVCIEKTKVLPYPICKVGNTVRYGTGTLIIIICLSQEKIKSVRYEF